MHRTKSFRRHQDWKHKEEVKRWMKEWGSFEQWNNPFWGRNWVNRVPQWEDPESIGKNATTPHPCSNICCGNHRKWYGETLDEKRSLEETLDIIEEMCYNKSIIK